MRIAVDYRPATFAPKTGIARQAKAIAEALSSIEGVELFLFSAVSRDFPRDGRLVTPEWEGLNLHRPAQRIRFEQGFLPGALRERRIDAYIATANSGLPWLGAPAGVRTAVLLHDLFQLNLPGRGLRSLPYRLFDTFNIRRSVTLADRVWTPSAFTAQQTGDAFPATTARLRVLPNRVERVSAGAGAPPLPERYWLAVGLREARKNIPLWIGAWAEARDQQIAQARNAQTAEARARAPAVPELVLVGLEHELPPEYRGRPDIRLVSGVADPALADIYRRAELLWHPSYAEGFGLPPLEALAQGTPVAVARGSSLDEVVPPAAIRFEPHDGAALKALMLRLAAEPPARDEPAFDAWVERFGEQAHRARVRELLDDLTER